MKRGQYLSPDVVHVGQRVIVVPTGEDVARGVGLGAYAKDGSEATVTEALHGAARRGAVQLFETPEAEAARLKDEAVEAAASAPPAPPPVLPPSPAPEPPAPPAAAAAPETHQPEER